MASEAGLNMTYGNLAVVSRQSGGKGSRGIALHQHHVGFETLTRILHRIEDPPGQRIERLIWPHDRQIEVGLNLEKLQGMVEHRTMLAGMNDSRLKFFRPLAQFVNHQSQFDRFRPGAEDCNNPALHEDCPPF